MPSPARRPVRGRQLEDVGNAAGGPGLLRQAARAGAGRAGGPRRPACAVPFTALEPCVQACRAARQRCSRRTCTRSTRARSPARSRRPCSWSWAWTVWCSAIPSGASSSARPTARCRRRCPQRSPPGSQPILCVGETEEERERGETERKLRHQVQEGLEKVADERLPDVVIAYEPIWAIGTGQVATPDQAQEAIGFVRALVGDRSRGRGEVTRVLYGGSVKPDERRGDPGPARRGRRARGRSEPRPRLLRPDHRRGLAVSVPSVCLVVLDGWGLAEPGPGNAVEQADTPVFDELWEKHPHSTLTAWGPAVGLPEGQMGNSEVGHLNLGAGAVVKQDITRIDDAVEDGSFAENEALRDANAAARDAGRLHLLGLVSDGGVHASLEHLRAIVVAGAGAGRPGHGDARVHGRPRHEPRLGRRPSRRGRAAGTAPAWPPWAAATSPWTATAAGTARSGGGTRSCTGRRGARGRLR